MKSYLEVLWLINGLCLYVSWHLAHLLTKNNCQKQRMMFCSAALSLVKSCWMDIPLVLFFILFCGFSFILSGWKLMHWLESGLFYFVLIHASSCLPGIEMVHMMIAAEASSLSWVMLGIILMLLDVISEAVLIHVVEHSELTVPVTIKTQQGQIECIGYIDTGNCCMHEHKPVIFTRYSFASETVLMITSMGQKKLYPALHAQIFIDSSWQDVVAVIAKDLQVDCLLHRSMR